MGPLRLGQTLYHRHRKEERLLTLNTSRRVSVHLVSFEPSRSSKVELLISCQIIGEISHSACSLGFPKS